MAFKLSSELVDASKESGNVIHRNEETHRMAEANRAFAREDESGHGSSIKKQTWR